MVKKLLFKILIISCITMFLYPISIAQATTIGNVIGGAENFLNMGRDNADEAINYTPLINSSNLVYNTLLIVGTCIAVIFGAILGIQFITGSVEQKVKVKESLIPFIIGCIVIFGAFGIWRLVILLLK